MESTKDRLYAFLSAKNLKPSVFEKTCGLSNGFCSKTSDKITDASLRLIKSAYPDFNTEWLRTGEGDMLISNPFLEHSKSNDDSDKMLAMVRMMSEFISLGKKNSEANLLNAEANKINARNLERLIDIIEAKLLKED